ncbi:hypothetical protein DRJ12_01495 [Candidatus Acetothermia bacterium]|nr:MAG: hypothetical protein DRJ12_01495 [Candidatus Acetothermia bacterium]
MKTQCTTASPGATIVIIPPGIPRLETGRRLAAGLIGGEPERIARGAHPDLIELSPMKGKERIGIEQVREVIRAGQFAPVEGVRKVCLIPHGEALTPEAENALLKVLEEPSRDLSFLILVGEAQDLLPTIRSRGRIVRLPSPSPDELAARLGALGYDERVIPYLIGLLSGEELAPFLENRVDVSAAIEAARAELDGADLKTAASLAVGEAPIPGYEGTIRILTEVDARGPTAAVAAARGIAGFGRAAGLVFLARTTRVLFAAARRRESLFPPHPGIDRLARADVVALAREAEKARRALEGYTSTEAVLLSFFLQRGGEG